MWWGDDPGDQHRKLKMEQGDHQWNSGSSSAYISRYGGGEKEDANIEKRQDNNPGEVQKLDLNLSLVPPEARWGLDLNLEPSGVMPTECMFTQARS